MALLGQYWVKFGIRLLIVSVQRGEAIAQVPAGFHRNLGELIHRCIEATPKPISEVSPPSATFQVTRLKMRFFLDKLRNGRHATSGGVNASCSRNRMVGTLRARGIGGSPEHIVCKSVEEFRRKNGWTFDPFDFPADSMKVLEDARGVRRHFRRKKSARSSPTIQPIFRTQQMTRASGNNCPRAGSLMHQARLKHQKHFLAARTSRSRRTGPREGFGADCHWVPRPSRSDGSMAVSRAMYTEPTGLRIDFPAVDARQRCAIRAAPNSINVIFRRLRLASLMMALLKSVVHCWSLA